MKKFFLFLILCCSIVFAEYPIPYQGGGLGGSDLDMAIDDINDELDSFGNSHTPYEQNLGEADSSDSRIVKIVQELMGQHTADDNVLGNPTNNADYSVLDKTVYELRGDSLDSSVGTIGPDSTAMSRIHEEFVEKQTAIDSNLMYLNAQDTSVSNAIINHTDYMYAYLDGTIVSNNPSLNMYEVEYIGEFITHSETNGTIIRILQELDGDNVDGSIGMNGSAIDRMADELSGETLPYHIGTPFNGDSALERIVDEMEEIRVDSDTQRTALQYEMAYEDLGLQNQIHSLQIIIANLLTRIETLESGTNAVAVTAEMVEDGRIGSKAVSIENNMASIQMNLQTTSNLVEGVWDPATNVNIMIPVNNQGAQFFRMGLE